MAALDAQQAWNATYSDYPADICIHELVEIQAAQTPDTLALADPLAQVTYWQLSKRSNQLAHYLLAQGVTPDTPVAVCIPRSTDLVVALLGILKAGGAYLPLDPAYPAERLTFMLEDSQTPLVLTRAGLLRPEDGLPKTVKRIALDDMAGLLANQPTSAPSSQVGPANLAYVIYTSGSTGRPKGVAIEHRSAINLITWHQREFAVGAGDRATQVASPAFDAAVWEIWPYLTTGASLHIPAEELRLLPMELKDWMVSQAITMSFLPTPIAERIIALPWDGPCSLRVLLTGGDRLQRHPDHELPFVLVNNYGPTENAVVSTSGLVELGADHGQPPSIGRSIANTEAYILDSAMQPVAVGAPGELYVGGVGLARYYLNRPDLTAERFVPHPFSRRPGSRLYRTGDRCQYRADGSIEFLGRIDFQVKVRGFRIELGEIEVCLVGHPAVKEAVAAIQEMPSGANRLVAFVAQRPGSAVDKAVLKEYLGQHLPEYMVPTAITTIDSFPLTPNGKIDRRALLLQAVVPAAGDRTAPATPVEAQVAAIWAEVFSMPEIGIHSNFFDLGGHSLLATQIVSRVNQTFGAALPMRQLFDTPTIAGLAAVIGAAGGQPAVFGSITAQDYPTGAVLPLSFAQERLWFLNQLDPASVAYTIPLAWRISGEVDEAALRRALNDLAMRHAPLRSTFPTVDGRPVARLSEQTPIPFEAIDLGGLDGAARVGEAERYLLAEAGRPFDLAEGPLLRGVLIRLDSADHLFALIIHHIIFDGWSVDIFTRELVALYTAALAGADAGLPALPIQYADYARWQRRWLQGEALEAQVNYWKRHLDDAPAAIDLPTDRPRPPVQTFNGALERFVIPADLTARLRTLAIRENATMFMASLAVFNILLARYSGQRDLVVGTPIAGRHQLETEPLIGMFVNTLALRTVIRGNPSFLDVLAQVRETTLGAYSHQDLPFEKLVEVLHPVRDLSYTPIFQVMFIVQNIPEVAGTRSDLEMRSLELPATSSQFDITFELQDTSSGLEGAVTYNTDLFDAATINRMAGHFQRLLAAVMADPTQAVLTIPLVAAARRVPSGAPAVPPLLHERVVSQAARTPRAAAVVGRDATLTYAELDEQSSRLAAHLRYAGVGPDVCVGVYLERTPRLLVVLLAVLKAGGAYVPLDPAYPAERLAFMIEDTRVAVLLAEHASRETLPSHAAQVIFVDALPPLPSVQPPKRGAGPENLAYIIYTSGSTGRPKGVMITHANAAFFMDWALEVFSPADLEGTLAATSMCFDISIFEFFAPLSCGGSVLLAENILHLAAMPATPPITLVNTVPSVFAEVLRDTELPPSVRVVNLAGEALPRVLVDQLYGLPTVERVYNFYGPSEDTTYSTIDCVARDGAGPPPLGRTIDNSEGYVLDGFQQPVPVGIAGELYLGGAGVSRGYFGRPALTAERYLPDPFSGVLGARMYRTGDRVRRQADGTLEYLGRMDRQVKLRGFRIELGEVEAALSEQAAVQEAAVVIKASPRGDPTLVGYVVARAGEALDSTTVQAALRERLPEYMVPSQVVVLLGLPRTSSGKLDRRALPEPDFGRAVAAVAALTADGEALAAIWAEVLRVPRASLDAHSNFFDLGGHSLLATQIVSRVNQTFGAALPMRQLFDTPTIAGLAAVIGAAGGQPAVFGPITAQDYPTGAVLPLSFAQERLWFLNQLDPASVAYTIPLAWRISGEVDEAALRRALNDLAMRHAPLRSTFPTVDGRPVARLSEQTPIPFEAIDLGGLDGTARVGEAERYLLAEAGRPFNLAEGPLLRGVLIRLDSADHLFALIIHHIIFDGWSVDIFTRELAALYTAALAGADAGLPALPIQYADYARWQRRWLQGEALEAQVNYWKRHLDDAPAAIDLPTDRPRPPVQTFNGALERFVIPADLTARLRTLAIRENATMFMASLAVFNILLARYSGQRDLVVGTPIAGRHQPGTEPLIGMFVNTLALRTVIRGNPSFLDVLAQVRETTLGAYSHQDLPFEKLVEVLHPVRDLSYTPIFQVMFIVQNIPEVAGTRSDLEMRSLELPATSSQFDITFELQDTSSGLEGAVTYNTDLFDAATINRMAGHFQRLLAAVMADPTQAVLTIPLVAAARRVPSGAPAVPPLLHERVVSQAARTPRAAAVVGRDATLTYAELDEQSSRLAAHLRYAGVGPDVCVGVYLERTPRLLVVLLAVLKAGGAYVPLDPAYPAERLAFMIEDTRVAVLLAEHASRETLPSHAAQVIFVDALPPLPSVQPPKRGAGPENLAYIIYTSGSTGRPKGVMITHANAAFFMDWALEVFSPADLEGTLAATSMCFDISIFEFFAPLSCGGSVLLAENILHLAAMPATPPITLVNTVPSVFAEVLRDTELPPSVRVVNLAGEALPRVLVDQLYGLPTVERVYNFYGPSEDTTYSTIDCVARDGAGPPPLGRTIDNSEGYVLDGFQQPVPVGIAGELYLGGAGVSRGYFGRPALTAERYLPDPFSGVLGARMYRTGDRVRRQADGTLEYLGRMDRQVKLRGFRIELGEVEAALSEQAAVQEAAVVIKASPRGDPTLVGYVVARAGEALDSTTVQAALRERLPEYMVPSQVVVLLGLPRTSSGKLDRRALPEPDFGRAVAAVAALTADGEALAAIWAEVLRVPRASLDAHSNFFDLGGHSLLAAQVISRVRDLFAIDLSIRALFEQPVFGDFADRIAARRREGAVASLPPLVAQALSEDDLPLSVDQERFWFVQQLDPMSAAYNISLALDLEGAIDGKLLERCFNAIVERHESLRAFFVPVNGAPTYRVRKQLDVPLALHDLSLLASDAAAAETERLTMALTQRPFDLARDPLIRTALIQTAPDAARLVMVLHHSVFDGWSLDVMARELTTLYQAGIDGRADLAATLTPLPIRYADYAAWQRGWLQSAATMRQLDYWRAQLAGAPPLIELPLDRPRPPAQTFRGAQLPVALDAELAGRLRVLSKREGATLFIVLLAAFKAMVAQCTDQRDLVIGMPIANRPHRETEALIGLFINSLPLRTRLPGNPSFRDIVRQVRATTLDAHDHQNIPLTRIVEAVSASRTATHAPIFQVMFDLGQDRLTALQIPGVRVSPKNIDPGTAMLDLTFDFVDTGDEIKGSIEYNTDLFESSTIAAIFQDFQATLSAVAANPNLCLAELPLASWPKPAQGAARSTEERKAATLTESTPESTQNSRQDQLAARRAQLSGSKQALIEKLLKREKSGPARPPLIERRADEGPQPLSFAQERLWFLDQLNPESMAYVITIAKQITGSLDPRLLERALAATVDRHEILRTTFREVDGQTSQVIAPEVATDLEIADLRTLDASERPAETKRLIAVSLSKPFCLSESPLLRLLLIRLEPTEQILLLTIHHIVFDGWSAEIFFRELGEFYIAGVRSAADLAGVLPALPIQYADYARWQRRWLQGEALEAQVNYWKRHLDDAPAAIDLPTDRPRPPVQTFNGALERFVIPADLTARLRTLAIRENATMFMASLAVFNILLARYSGQRDLVVGTPIAGRHQPGTEPLIGMFVNTLALRTVIRGNPSFLDVLAQVRETTLGAYSHQDLPFEKLVEVLHPVRDLSYTPIFQVMFIVQNIPEVAGTRSDLETRSLELPATSSQFDITFELQDTSSGLEGAVTYNTDLFDAATINRMAGHFQRLLAAVMADPTQAVLTIPLVAAARRVPSGAPAVPPLLHERVVSQAARTPRAAAVVGRDATLTYAELDEQSSRLAAHLRYAGVGPDVCVGVYLERTPRLLVVLLAVLKAGGAYVPLDPAYPAERLAFMIEDTRVAVLLAEHASRETLPSHAAQVIFVDALPPLPSVQPPKRGAGPENLAYIIYTSGSTGRPKGVMITHANAAFFMDWALEVFSPADLEGTLAATSMCFDISIFEFFAPLSCGGSVLLAENILHLAAMPATPPITLVNTVPSVFAEVLRDTELPPSVRVVNLAGEALPRVLVDQLYGLPTVERVYNFYGPSEDTTYSTIDCVARDGAGPPPLGRTIDNSEGYVLDGFQQPVPVGIAGELYLGGAGVSRGYFGRPALTAERYLPDPFSGVLGARMYRTGDRVRRQADGTLEYLGRMDRQVKLRGFRIELGEVEAALSEQAAVQEAAVVIKASPRGDPTLVGYVVARAGEALDSTTVQAALRERLPEYMVPSQVVVLLGLPRTSSGKLDRRALPEPDFGRAVAAVAALTADGEALAAIWAEVLRVPRASLDAHSNFFALGGHSLLATRIVARVRQELQIDLPLRRLFESPTLGELAAVLRVQPTTPTALVPPLTAQARPERIPLSFAQERLWFLEQLDPGQSTYLIPLVRRVRGALDWALLERCLNTVVARHESLRTTFQAVDGTAYQVIAPELHVPMLYHDLRGLNEASQTERLAEVRRFLTETPFDLAAGPLLRAGLIQVRHAEYVLILTLHHSISDGWSLDVLLDELTQLYAAGQAGTRALAEVLTPLAVQYADYALWQRSWLRGAELSRQIAYWKTHLAGAPPLLELPGDFPRPAHQSFRGGTLSFAVGADLTAQLRELAQVHEATLFMTLLAAFTVLLARYSGQGDIVVGTPIAGRTHAASEGLIGMFVNTLALRTRVGDNPDFLTLLARVRQTALGGYAHQDVPFEKLVEELQPVRNLSYSPIFQVFFMVQNTLAGESVVAGLASEGEEQAGETSKFDLSLALQETGEGLTGSLEYSRDLFSSVTAARIAEHFQMLLVALVATSTRPVLDLPFLTAAEQARIIDANLRPAVEPAGAPRLPHRLIADQAERTPEAIAVVVGAASLLYRDIDHQSDQWAQALRRHGVGPETIVAICLERSPTMLVALLAVLKSGGAFALVNPRNLDQLPALIEELAPAVVLRDATAPQVPATAGRAVLDLSADWAEIASLPAVSLDHMLHPDSAACLVQTDGAAGTRRLVVLSHRALGQRLLAAQAAYPLYPTDRVLHSAALETGDAVWAWLAPLTAGSAVVLDVAGGESAGPSLIETVTAQDVTVARLLPSQLDVLLDAPRFTECTTLRMVLAAGEPLSQTTQDRFFERSAAELYNLYGAAETTLDALAWRCARDADLSDPSAPLGAPLEATQVALLDDQGRVVPVGIAGELYLGGAGVSRGYFGRPALTAERYLPDPFSGVLGARMYRTGDRALYRADGMLEYRGRVEQQVKLRGFRIELGEVEAALSEQAAVQEAAVVIKASPRGDPTLVGYVVARAGEALDSTTVQAALRERLPEYMVPSQVVVLLGLPRTSSGKLDRRALPEPDFGRAVAAVAALTADGEALAAIWAEVLRVPRASLDAHSNFFALGGHSLLATRIVARVRQELQIDLPLRRLFESPTLGELAAALRVQPTAPTALVPPLLPTERPERIPLSFAQERLWFLEQLDPGQSTYLIPLVRRVRGALDWALLERCLNTVVARHESLRTTFQAVDGTAYQVIAPELHVPMLYHDLRGLNEASQTERLAEVRRFLTETPFDLAAGPLLRAGLIQVRHAEYVLILTLHHSISDGWSLDVLLDELTQLYAAGQAGTRALAEVLTPLAVQYADYALWQRSWLRGAELSRQIAYWKTHLAGAPPLLELPGDFPRPAHQSFRGGTLSFAVGADLTAQLRELAQVHEATLFMTLLAAFTVLLARYSGQGDIVVGTPIAGRTHAASEGLIGMFVNTLALRTRVGDNPDFLTLLARVRQTALGGYAHQDVPFEKLVEELQPVRNFSHPPIFQVMFMAQNTQQEAAAVQGLESEPLDSDSGTSKFDLSLALQETAAGLEGSFEYCTDLFAPATIERMVGHFQSLLAALTAEPTRPVLSIPFIADEERTLLVETWNATKTPAHTPTMVHELIAAQAQRTPAAVAARYGDQTLTYRELIARANQLAHALQERGVGPDVLVGICVERSLDLMVGLLGIVIAGGAYVPLDPSYPAERLAFMLEDARVAALVTQKRLLSGLPADSIPRLCLDTDWSLVAGNQDCPPASAVTPAHLAYMIYTSGSTGRPKGTMIQHSGLANYLTWAVDAYAMAAGDGAPVYSSVSFDLTITGLFGPLLAGRTVHLLPEDAGADGLGANLSVAETYSLVKITPAHLEILNHQMPAHQAAGRTRAFVIGGENLRADMVAFWRDHAPQTALINEYGPTETVVGCCVYTVTTDTPAVGVLPIGRPIANTQMYVLDPRLQLVPIGVVGELYIGGAGVGRGYHRRPDLTAERFVPDPFGGQPGARLYKTGDLGRILADGTLECLGRVDHQVKVRGFRIELEEIEAALLRQAGVREAVVAARRQESGDIQLAAYVVAAPDNPLQIPTLKQSLQELLPAYMAPSHIMLIDELPLTSNGKVDRGALPAPAQTLASEAVLLARDALELRITQVWESILEVRPIGVNQNFFDLGGHSLAAVRLMDRIEKAFNQSLPLSALFQGGTIEQLAVILRQQKAGSGSALIPIQPGGSQRPLFLVHPIGGNVVCYIQLARAIGGDQPVYGLEAIGLHAGRAPQRQIEVMASHYIEEIRTVQPDGPYLLGGWSFGGVVALEMAQQLILQGQDVALLTLIDSQPPAADRSRMGYDPALWLLLFAEDTGLISRDAAASLHRVLGELAPDAQLEHLLGYLQSLGALPPDADLERITRLFTVFTSNMEANDAYNGRIYQQPALLFQADDRGRDGLADHADEWRRLAPDLVCHVVPGTHYSLLQAPVIDGIAEQIRAAIGRYDTR
ncbi:amino acid adenylation domain [Herpetosiphon aurantiacus DSM 785]|uniref:Amino acid adenylation domain n=1 Tax=Herpetosiphon aurantiacus (strain ATCC 23779 / DSM 785 / 114-95) TaxID=316274 RepID=A9AV17_HERA2|nr:amino acid adenylation domain [Herpetosiphon aurantiacus DSM 785]